MVMKMKNQFDLKVCAFGDDQIAFRVFIVAMVMSSFGCSACKSNGRIFEYAT